MTPTATLSLWVCTIVVVTPPPSICVSPPASVIKLVSAVPVPTKPRRVVVPVLLRASACPPSIVLSAVIEPAPAVTVMSPPVSVTGPFKRTRFPPEASVIPVPPPLSPNVIPVVVMLIPATPVVVTSPSRVVVPVPANCVKDAALMVLFAVTFAALLISTLPSATSVFCIATFPVTSISRSPARFTVFANVAFTPDVMFRSPRA